MGFRLSELCRVLLKEPEEGAGEEEPETEEPETEEREVKPLSTKAADAEPIRERQRVSEISRNIPSTNTGNNVTCFRGGPTGVAADRVAAAASEESLEELLSGVNVEPSSDVSGHRGVSGCRVSPDKSETAIAQTQHKPVAFVSPFTDDSCYDQEQVGDPDYLRGGADTCTSLNCDSLMNKGGEVTVLPFVCQNDAAGRKPDGILIEGGSNGFVDGQHNSSNVNGCVISTSSGKKQKGTKLPKKKGKKHKKGKQSPQRELPSESASQKPNEQKMLREQIDDATVSSGDLARPTTIELTTTYEATEQDDIMFSRGVIEMSAGADDGGHDLLNGYNQTHRAEVKRTTNGDVPGFCSRREVDEILQHKKDVDVYVREIERQHYLSYGGAAPAASDANSSDAIITDDSLVKEHSDTTNDDADVCNGGSTIATIVTVTADDVAPITDHDNDHNPGSLSDTYSDPVRRSTRTKKGKLRHIVELNRSPPEVSIDQHPVEPSPPCDESCDVPCDESGDESCDEHQVVEIQVVPACRGRTDIQALIASTEAINVDALFDESLQDCLASMTISYSDSSLNGTHYDTEAAATNGLLPETQRIDSETVKKNIEDVEECSYPVQYDDDVASDNQGDIDNVSRHDTPADNTLSTGQLDPEVGTIVGETDVNKVGSTADHDSETDVVTRHILEDNDTRRPSESFSDDILFDEGFRVDDAWDFEMDAVSDEISLGSFNTVIAVEAMNIDTHQAGVMTVNERFNDAVESVAIDNNVMVSTFEAANMTMGTSDAITDSNGGMTANISSDRVCCVRKGGHALPQSERSESFEYKESSPVLEHYRSSSEESDRFSRSHSIERCESFECEVRKQLQHPGVTSGNQLSEALETDDVSGFVVVSSEPSIPTEVELRIVEPGDDDDDTVASRCRETHARQYTMENTCDDYDLVNSCDNSDTHSGRNEKSEASADDNSIDFETVHGREKTARAMVDDVILFNESAGKSRVRSDSGERRGETVEEEGDNVAESTHVIVTNGENNKGVITDEGDVSRDVAAADVPFTSEAEHMIRDACGYGTMSPFGEDDSTVQHRPLHHMNTPIIVITDYCDPTPYTVGLDDCQTRDCDETETRDCDTRVGETASPADSFNGKYGERTHVVNAEGDIADVAVDTQTCTSNESHDTESSISRECASASATSSGNVVSDNWGSDAADVVRRRYTGGASAAAATVSPVGATAVASTSRQTEHEPTNLPNDVTVPRRPDTSAVDSQRQEFLSDLLVEKACLEGFFSNIGTSGLTSR